jgi:hypothetical protein
VRLQRLDVQLAVGRDGLHRQMPMPFDALSELGGAREGEQTAGDAGGEILQLEGDGLEARREGGRAAAVFIAHRSARHLERRDAHRRQGLVFGWRLLTHGRHGRLRLERHEVDDAVGRDRCIEDGSIELNPAEGIRSVPQGGQVEIDEQPVESQQFSTIRGRQREILQIQLEEERVKADVAHGRGDVQRLGNLLQELAAKQPGRDHEAGQGV